MAVDDPHDLEPVFRLHVAGRVRSADWLGQTTASHTNGGDQFT